MSNNNEANSRKLYSITAGLIYKVAENLSSQSDVPSPYWLEGNLSPFLFLIFVDLFYAFCQLLDLWFCYTTCHLLDCSLFMDHFQWLSSRLYYHICTILQLSEQCVRDTDLTRITFLQLNH